MPTLGVALITKNAASHLAECLSSVAFADRIVVLDSGSNDDTLAIALKHGAQVRSTTDWPGFGPQKNRALALLDTDWILMLDADEIVSPKLAQSIRHAVEQPETQVYRFSRLSNYCGRWIHYSGWRPDYVSRLFKRGAARFSDDMIHECLVFEGNAPVLAGDLLHYSFDNLETVLDKVNRYSSAGAVQRLARGESASLAKALWRGFAAFVRSYILRRGFLDGQEGLILAISNAEGTYYRYLKLMYLGKDK